MIFTILKKELKETLRDRRTLLAMIVIPVLIFPVILGLIQTVSKNIEENESNKTFTIALGTEQHNTFTQIVENTPEEITKKKLLFFPKSLDPSKVLENDSIDAVITFETDFDYNESQEKNNEVTLYYRGKNILSKSKSEAIINFVNAQLLQQRLSSKNIAPELLQPINVTYINETSDKEMIGKLAGGFLPYLFIIFGFIGCMYPSIDLFTGEKERKTLETILTLPVPRWKILTGKMAVIVISGLAASTFALLGLFLGIEFFGVIEDEAIMTVIKSILSLKFILSLYLLLLPLTIFFAGILVPVTIYAKSFKEAQSIITPLNFIVILPALTGFIPTFELSASTALIPIVNIVLASKELVAGTIVPLHMFIAFITMLLLATISVLVSYKHFGKESNII